MIRIAKWLSCLAVIAGIVLLGTASPARADIQLQLTLSDGSSTASAIYDVSTSSFVSQNLTGSVTGSFSYSSTLGLVFNGTVGDFTAGLSYGNSNSPGTPYLATTNNANDVIINNASGSRSLTVEVSATGFMSPQSPPPLSLNDTITASMITGTASATAQGFADKNDGLGVTTDFQGQALSLPTIGTTGSVSDNGSVYGFSPNGNTYSLTFVSTFNVSGGGTINVLGGGVSTAVPEPASMMAALSAMPFLALGAWLRRRKQVAVA